MVFGASSLYLVLKVGLTVSASIPVAVISITIFRIFSKFGFRDATILQNNIVQTAGSAGDGSTVTKFDAPKATLMSYIIKGILSRKFPWALVLLGVIIAIVLEMSGIPSLAFAVGVYLPLASSSPIFIGGMIRLLVDRYLRVKFRHKNLSDVKLIAEGDKSRGVLLASGYIAGGAITGIVIAVVCEQDMEEVSRLADHIIEIPSTDELLLPILEIVPLQLLAYHIAVRRGCDVDQPRNVAKSVTVE